VLDHVFLDVLHGLRRVFDDDRLSIAASGLYGAGDGARLVQLAALAAHVGAPLVATNDVHAHVAARRPLQDVLTCIRHRCTIEQAGLRLFPNAERHLKPPAEMSRLFAAHPGAVARTVEIARRAAGFDLDQLRYQYPDEVCPPGRTAMEHLTGLTRAGADERYPRGVPERLRAQIEHELRLIDELNYAPYFLTVHDLIRFARSRGILCQGRGAAANSAVCYCLGITAVDPGRIELLFERFISRERNEPPDIDVDFEHERREEVIQYLYGKYGRDRAALTAEVITYRGRSAVRDVGKALGLSLDGVDRLARDIDWWSDRGPRADRIAALGLDPDHPTIRFLMHLSREILGFPRHRSQHVGGFVITRGPLADLVPVENAAMPDRTVIEWDKDDIDAMGMLKVDVLGLGMLTCVRKCFDTLNLHTATRRRDEETERRSDSECPVDRKEQMHGERQDLSRPCGVAERDGTGGEEVRGHREHAVARAVRTDRADPTIGRVGALEHRRGFWPRDASQPAQVPADRPRIAQRADHAARTGPPPEDAQADRRTAISRQRGRSRSPVADPESAADQDELISSTSSLRLSVSPSPPLQLHTIPSEDPAVYDMICRADTIGVFQIESRAQMTMLPRLRPRCFYDLVIEVAIVRPGPIQGDMVHPYLRRRNGQEPVAYPTGEVRRVLGRTLGVPLFQEQAMALAVVAAGFTPGEADQLRRAMAAWKRKGNQIARFEAKFIGGMLERGYEREFADRCFRQLKGFSEYGFPESHAASFAHIVYVSAWLKLYHPAAFAAALLNSQPMGFYAPAQIVRDAQEHGVEVRPVDVNVSQWDCTLEERRDGETERRREGAPGHDLLPASSPSRSVSSSRSPCLRLGLRLVKGLPEREGRRIVEFVRERGGFASIESLHRAGGISAAMLRRLAAADAFGSMGLDRQSALWHVRSLRDPPQPAPLFRDTDQPARREPALPPVPPPRTVVDDYASLGLSLKAHPMSFLRDQLQRRGVSGARELSDASRWRQGSPITVAGVVLVRQRPATAAGIVFMTLEDETGIANLIVRPKVYERHRRAARHGVIILARGTVERQGAVVHVLTTSLEALDARFADLLPASRDFH
jgi:error-prone DNA polymerase